MTMWRTVSRAIAASAVAASLLLPGLTTATAAPPQHRPSTTSAPLLVDLPGRETPVSTARMRDMAVAFVDVGTATPAVLDKVQQAGVKRVQIVASWAWIARDGEASPDWSTLDTYFAEARKRGLSTIVHINATPGWVHPDLVGDASYWDYIWYLPTRTDAELAAWGRFTAQLSTRYRGQVEGYEIWNEENWRDFSKPVESPVAYASMLRSAYLNIKASDRRAQVIFGGTTRSDPGFLDATYSALAKYPDAARNDDFFDVMGVHPYADSNSPDNHESLAVRENAAGGEFDDNFLGIDRVRAEMVRHGDAHKQIYLGEFAYSIDPHAWFVVESDALRAYYLRRAYELSAQRPWVNGLAWFQFNSGEDGWQSWVLLQKGEVETRSYRELAQLTGARPAPAHVPNSVRPTASGAWQISSTVKGSIDSRLYANGVEVAASPTGRFTWTPSSALAGRAVTLQVVSFTATDTVESGVETVLIGGQRVVATPGSVKLDRGIRVEVGLRRAPGIARVIVRDSRGNVVTSHKLDQRRHASTSRYEFVLKVAAPGTYSIEVVDQRQRALATSAEVTVVPVAG